MSVVLVAVLVSVVVVVRDSNRSCGSESSHVLTALCTGFCFGLGGRAMVLG